MRPTLDEIRPLLAGTVRWDDAGASISTGREEVRVEGSPEALRAILGDCDGQLPVHRLAERHAEARDLIASLLELGGVVDAEHAWRILHRQSSVGSALGRGADADEQYALLRATFAPRSPGGPRVPLAPDPSATGATAAARRSMTPADPAVPADFGRLSAVLAAAYGFPERSAADDPSPRSGTVPSAGALYPLAVHVLLREPLGPLAPGLWWHDPRDLQLQQLRAGVEDAGPLFVPEPSCDALVARRRPIVFLSADLERPSRKYGARAYRYALIEAGAAMQAACLVATELGLPLRPIGGIDDGDVHGFLELPETAVALLALLVGN